MEVWLGNTDLDCPPVTSNLLGPSVPWFQTPSTCILPFKKPHSTSKQKQAKWQFCIF